MAWPDWICTAHNDNNTNQFYFFYARALANLTQNICYFKQMEDKKNTPNEIQMAIAFIHTYTKYTHVHIAYGHKVNRTK